jgi:hypothetical protein
MKYLEANQESLCYLLRSQHLQHPPSTRFPRTLTHLIKIPPSSTFDPPLPNYEPNLEPNNTPLRTTDHKMAPRFMRL